MRVRVLLVWFSLFCLLDAAFRPQAEAQRPGEAIESVGSGAVNWTTGMVTATGVGSPPSKAVNESQRRAMAERAAFSVAVRNLLEAVKGIRVDSATSVENMVVKSDAIRTQVTGIVKGARTLKAEYQPDGSVEVTVGIAIAGELFDAILPKRFGQSLSVTGPPPSSSPVPSKPIPGAAPAPSVPPASPPQKPAVSGVPSQPSEPPPSQTQAPGPLPPVPASPPAVSAESYTGLVVDARGLGVKPALIPRLLDEQGKELYAGGVLSREQAVRAGVAGYAKDLVSGTRQPRVTDNPLILKALKASESKNTDIVLGSNEAMVIEQTEPDAHYLKQARVVVVYD